MTFDPMPQPKRTLPPAIQEWRAEQNTKRILIVSGSIVLVVSLALIMYVVLSFMGVSCHV